MWNQESTKLSSKTKRQIAGSRVRSLLKPESEISSNAILCKLKKHRSLSKGFRSRVTKLALPRQWLISITLSSWTSSATPNKRFSTASRPTCAEAAYKISSTTRKTSKSAQRCFKRIIRPIVSSSTRWQPSSRISHLSICKTCPKCSMPAVWWGSREPKKSAKTSLQGINKSKQQMESLLKDNFYLIELSLRRCC